MNTYGLYSVNRTTFNQLPSSDLEFPKSTRDTIFKLLKINNCVLNILGYIPVVSCVSGLVRMGIGAGISITTLAIGTPENTSGAIIGRLYDEALYTGITQFCRGILEVCYPIGVFVNPVLDVVGTVINLSSDTSFYSAPHDALRPHSNPTFPAPFCLLEIV